MSTLIVYKSAITYRFRSLCISVLDATISISNRQAMANSDGDGSTRFKFVVNELKRVNFSYLAQFVPKVVLTSSPCGPDLTVEDNVEMCKDILSWHIESGECGSISLLDINQLVEYQNQGTSGIDKTAADSKKEEWKLDEWEAAFLENVDFSFCITDESIAAARKAGIPDEFPFFVCDNDSLILCSSAYAAAVYLPVMGVNVVKTMEPWEEPCYGHSIMKLNVKYKNEFWKDRMLNTKYRFTVKTQREKALNIWRTNMYFIQNRNWQALLQEEYEDSATRIERTGTQSDMIVLDMEISHMSDQFIKNKLHA